MNSVLTRPQLLLYSPPETRGMLLYQLTRHGTLTKADLRNWDSFEVLSRRKRAVVTIIKSVQTVRDYENTLQHMHPEGKKAGSWKLNEREILQFLEIGLGDSDFDDEVKQYVNKLRESKLVLELHEEPAKGYAVAFNDTMQYMAQSGNHPLFACGGTVGVVNGDEETVFA